MNTVPYHLVEAATAEIDARLAQEPESVSLRFDRAQFLELLGRRDEAKRDYFAVLEKDQTHVEALNALGLLHMGAGNRKSARTLFTAALRYGPGHAAARANLAYVQVLDGNLQAAHDSYEAALRIEPTLAIAHHGLAEIAERHGDRAAAAEHRARGLRYCPVTIHRYTGTGRPIHLLALGTAALGNVATDQFFDSATFLLASLIVEHVDTATPLPPHDVIFNVIGEADLCAGPLTIAAALTARSDATVINKPAAVLATRRAANARRMGKLDGVTAPRIETVPRPLLAMSTAAQTLAEHGFVFPLLIRSPGYHTGDHFVKVDARSDLAAAIAALPGEELLVIEYVDVRDRDGCARKYRVMSVDGTLYPLHLAISRDWKVHYFRADMAENAANRAQDEAFLNDMETVLGPRALAALGRIGEMLALDYAGIDFALDPTGNVIVFEANASMIVPVPDQDEKWAYRRAPVARIHAAVRRMIVRRATARI